MCVLAPILMAAINIIVNIVCVCVCVCVCVFTFDIGYMC